MAKIYPNIENIQRLKVKPTDGEWFLINYLLHNFDDDAEIYFQPFLNSDRPDFVLIRKGVGAIIIEVKDWNLDSYYIDETNNWFVKSLNQHIKTPFRQVFNYKDNMFSLHVNGLLENKIKNKDFYGRIQVYVYFHKSTKKELDSLFNFPKSFYKNKSNEINEDFKNKKITYDDYENKSNQIQALKKKIDRDLNISITQGNLNDLKFPDNHNNILFKNEIYNEFKRILNPPFHTLEEGKEIIYTKEQKKVIESKEGFEKIKGVAGSGKTTVLAKRAVNAHIRHGNKVLILMFNLTLKNFIKDKISDVRDGFDWKYFEIINYHSFIGANLNNYGIENTLENYDNKDVFKGHETEIIKYKTILIDEIQDFKTEWIELIKKYFLEENGEMVLFGDEKQNIYGRLIEDKQIVSISGFKNWKTLKQSARFLENGGRIANLSKSFQKAFLSAKYEIDETTQIFNPSLNLGLYENFSYDINSKDYITQISNTIIHRLKEFKLVPNDTVILCSNIKLLRELDSILRNNNNFKTLTTFETKEMYEKILDKNKKEDSKELENIRKNKKINFQANNGLMKLSTIQSFKGFEAENVFVIISQEDDEEIIYTALTRSRFNILVFTPYDSKYINFFSAELEQRDTINTLNQNLKVLQEAIKEKTYLTIDYSQHSKTLKYENIKPYKIIFMNDNHYLACEVFNEYKFSMFRINNILNIEKNLKTFSYDIDLLEFIQNIQTPFSKYTENYSENLVEVLVEVDSSKVRFFENKKFLPSQEFKEKLENGNIIISFNVTQEMEVEDLIKKWLPYLKVIKPISLDEKIKIDIKKYLNYN